MSFILCGPDSINLNEIASLFNYTKLQFHICWLKRNFRCVKIPSNAKKIILVFPKGEILYLGELISHLRKSISLSVPIIVCTQRVPDIHLLYECGASKVVTSKNWSSKAVGERILGELIYEEDVKPFSCSSLLGATETIQKIYQDIKIFTKLIDPILITGESGTGKELVAQAIHCFSKKPGKLYAINCAELKEDILESELFGHSLGSFTGAVKERKGILEHCGKGNIFLDEIGELSLTLQAKFLRVLEQRQIRPLGSNEYTSINVRFIFATNKNLASECDKGFFRKDLYERLNGFTMHLPALKDRKADIPILANHFVEEFNKDHSTRNYVSSEIFDSLFEYEWPGNIRELRNVIRRAAAYSNKNEVINETYLQNIAICNSKKEGFEFNNKVQQQIFFNPNTETLHDVQKRLRIKYFNELLKITGNDKTKAAKLAGVSRSQFYEILKQL